MSIKKNFVYNITYQLLIILIPLITMPYLARVIGVEGVGIYSLTQSIANYFVLFAMLGLNNYGNRSIAKVRDNKELLSQTFWNIYFMQLFTSLVVIISYLIYIFLFNPPYYSIAIIQILFVLSAMFDINWLFFGLEKFKVTVIRNTAIKILTLLTIFLFVRTKSDFTLYTLIMATSILISQLLLWPYLTKIVIWKKPSFNEIFKHIKPSLVLFISVISISLYKIMDKIMLGSISDIIQLGYFENAEKINYVQISLATALGTVMLPRMSNLVAKGNIEKTLSLIRDSMQFVLFLSIALSFGLIAISREFIPMFLGNNFSESSNVLTLLAPTGILVSWANVIRTQYLLPNNKDGIYIISVILGGIINLIANFIFIPTFGAVGAAIGTLLAEGTVMIYQTFSVRKSLDINQYIKDSIVFIPIGIVMLIGIILISQYVENTVMGIFLQVITGTFIYLALTIIYFYVFKKSRYQYFMGFFKNTNK